MATTEGVIEAFEDLGIRLEDPKCIDRLVNLKLSQVLSNFVFVKIFTSIFGF